ncbi:MAG: NADH-ubiquinone oxidoreductase-F iron-sulfur binding region domain-containing protein [Chloroflexota bacterium]|nr:NADH-ubiquinone oxidoreductase-F iron-sulfur binding region domain-containing protein [Chloroflexota bacterium]
MGADETLAAIRQEVSRRGLDADVAVVGCWGLCFAEPLVEIAKPNGSRVLYQRVTADRASQLVEEALAEGDPSTALRTGLCRELALATLSPQPLDSLPADWRGVLPLSSLDFLALQERRLMANCGVIEPASIDHYIARGGYEGLARALSMSPEDVIEQVSESGLWGRGGAAFPTGRKWEFLRGAKVEPKYLIGNADEGDPGAFVNRNLMESDPHSLIEGMVIGGYATGASYGYIYVRDEYPLCVERMELALRQARERGLLGQNILGSAFSYDMEVVRGAGSYVCGEETGLLASIEDARGMPKIRPPYPAQAGVYAKPTNVNNVETYANVPLILRHGAPWYISAGSERNKGTKMFSLSGHIQRVGVVEVPFGTPLRRVVYEAGGGPPGGRALKAVQPGGPLSGIIHADHVDIPLEPESFRELGASMGGGGLVILDDSNCVIDLCLYFEWFAEDESCGRCTTCRGGTQRMVEILKRIARGTSRPSDIGLLRLLADAMRNANCGHGQAAPTAVMNIVDTFAAEVQEHIEGKRCPARVCPGLIRYDIVGDSPRLTEAAAICPTAAIVATNGQYAIDQGLCIRCDACREVAPEAVQVGDEFGA